MYLFHLDLFSSVLAMKIIDAIKIEFLLFFGTSLYIVFRMLPVVMISWLLVSVYTSNELLSSLEKYIYRKNNVKYYSSDQILSDLSF